MQRSASSWSPWESARTENGKSSTSTRPRGESQAAWEAFLSDLYRRGLENLKLVVTDGGSGLLAALPLAYPHVPHQRYWAHKTRNVLDLVKKADQEAVKKDLHEISHAKNQRQAHQAAQAFKTRWESIYPKATACLLGDLPDLLAFHAVRTDLPHTALRTTNAIKRRFREVRRRTRPMGTFSDQTSIERILFAVFMHENSKEGYMTPFLVTQNS